MSEFEKSKDSKSRNALRHCLNKAKTSLFALYNESYKDYAKHLKAKSTNGRGFFYHLSVAYTGLQLLTLTVPTSVNNWSYFESTVHYLSLIRLDYLAANLGMSIPVFLVATAIIALVFVSWAYLFFKKWKDIEFSWNCANAFLFLPLEILHRLFFLPFLCLYMGVFKQSLFASSSAFNYNDVDGASLDIGTTVIATSPVLIILLILVYFEIIFNYDQFLTRSEHQICARAHSMADKTQYTALILIVFSHFFIHPVSHGVHLAISGSLSLLVSSLYLYYLPYFKATVNFASSACFYLTCIGAFSHLLGYYYDSGTIVVQSIIFLYPVNLLLFWIFIRMRKTYIRRKYKFTSTLDSEYQFELLIRELTSCYLNNKDNPSLREKCKEKIESLYLKLNSLCYGNKMVAIWQFVYIRSILKDPGLASFKMTSTSNKSSGLEADFHCYKLSAEFHESMAWRIEEINYLRFQILYEEANKLDKKVCYNQIDFWIELSKNWVNISKLESISIKLSHSLGVTREFIEKLVGLYPNNSQALQFFGSFLCDIYNDTETGYEIQRQAEFIRSRVNKLSSKVSYFNETMGIVIASASADNFGQIETSNSRAMEIIGNSEDMNIFSFLPEPLNKQYTNKTASKLIRKATSTQVPVPKTCFIVDTGGFLIEVVLQVHLTSLYGRPYLFVLIDLNEEEHECIYYDSSQVIRGHTRKAAEMLGLGKKNQYLKGRYLKEVIDKLQDLLKGFVKTPKMKHLNKKSETIYVEKACFNLFQNEFNLFILDKEQVFLSPEVIECKSYDLNGILKQKNQKAEERNTEKNSEKKVWFKEEIAIKELEITDFNAGKKVGKSVKDLDTVTVEKMTFEEEKDIKKMIKENKIIELSEIQESDLNSMRGTSENNKINHGKSTSSSVAGASQAGLVHIFSNRVSAELTRSIFRFKCFFFLTILLIIMAVIGVSVYLTVVLDMHKASSIVEDVGSMLQESSFLSIRSREINILNSEGAVTQDQIDQFSKHLGHFKTLKTTVLESKNLFKDEEYSAWEKHSGEILEQMRSKIDLYDTLIQEGMKFENTQDYSIENPSFFYIFRNGMFETAESLNVTLDRVIDKEQDTDRNTLSVILFIAIGGAFTLVACFVLIIIPGLKQIEERNREIWEFLFCIPFEMITEIKGKNEERLEQLHKKENYSQNSERLSLDLEKRRKLRPRKKFFKILMRILVYYAFTLTYLLMNYFMVYSPIDKYLVPEPVMLNWTTQAILNVNLAYFWLEELRLLKSEISYFNIVPEFQTVSDPVQEIDKILMELKYFENEILNSKIGKNVQTQDVIDIIATSADKEDRYLSKGLHYAVIGYMREVKHYLHTQDELHRLASYRDSVTRGFEILRDRYIHNSNTKIEQILDFLLYSAIFYAIFVLLLFFVFYMPFISSIKREIESIWNLSDLLPDENKKKIIVKLNRNN